MKIVSVFSIVVCNLIPTLPLHSNSSDCGGIEFDSSRYFEKYLPKSLHFGLKFQTTLAFGQYNSHFTHKSNPTVKFNAIGKAGSIHSSSSSSRNSLIISATFSGYWKISPCPPPFRMTERASSICDIRMELFEGGVTMSLSPEMTRTGAVI